MIPDADDITVVPDDSPIGWHPRWLTPKMRRRAQAEIRVSRIVQRTMGRIPIVGRVMATFWTSLALEGWRSTCTPRWGAMTWAFLNDGYRPSLWHTWRSMTHGPDDPYTGLWMTDGAPRSKAHADEMLARYEYEREKAGLISAVKAARSFGEV